MSLFRQPRQIASAATRARLERSAKRSGVVGALLTLAAVGLTATLWAYSRAPLDHRQQQHQQQQRDQHHQQQREVEAVVQPHTASLSGIASKAAKMALRTIPASSLHVSKPTWWLESRFHFSFADYYNPSNVQFGVLRVLNDDLVKGKSGFSTHPHRDMEIFSYVLDGWLSHKDSMGNAESLPRGSVQYISAGTGVFHSEMNNQQETLRFLQVWIQPDRRGHKPNYGSRRLDPADRHNRWNHIITGAAKGVDLVDTGSGIIPIHQDVNVFVTELDAGKALQYELGKDRQAYLVMAEGSGTVNGSELGTRDALEAATRGAPLLLSLEAGGAGAHVLMIEMPKE